MADTYKGPGKLTIGRPQGVGVERITISIEDGTSGCRVCELAIPLDSFAKALTGLGYVECKIEVFTGAPIGKVREVKREVVSVPKHNWKNRDVVARKACAPFEVDGWRANYEDASNSHCVVEYGKDETTYGVSFVRFVDKAVLNG